MKPHIYSRTHSPRHSLSIGPPSSTCLPPPPSTAPPQLSLLLDTELAPLPWEALPSLRAGCAAVSRCPSLHQLAAVTAAAAAANDGLGSFDLSSLTPIVDPKYECSAPEQARGGWQGWGLLGGRRRTWEN